MRLHLLISGRVQGVWYRGSTQQEARRLGLCGWVRNLPDGRVEAQVQGAPEDVEALVAWCHRGPGTATVTGVDRRSLPDVSDEADFDVRR